jgi:hypothetical protein
MLPNLVAAKKKIKIKIKIVREQRVKERDRALGKISGSQGGEYENGSDVAPCSLVEVYRRLRGAYCLCNVGKLLPYYMAQQPRRQPSSEHRLFVGL